MDLSQELTALNGYYIDYDMLKGTSMDEIKANLNRLKAGTPIMLELKGGYGSFYYTSGLTGAVSSASVNVSAVDELIQYIRSKGFYMIARVSAFRDYDFGNRNVTSGLYVKSRIGLWMDSGGCQHPGLDHLRGQRGAGPGLQRGGAGQFPLPGGDG